MKYALCTNKCHLSINLSCININWRPPTITINITLPLPILNFQLIESQITPLNIELNWNNWISGHLAPAHPRLCSPTAGTLGSPTLLLLSPLLHLLLLGLAATTDAAVVALVRHRRARCILALQVACTASGVGVEGNRRRKHPFLNLFYRQQNCQLLSRVALSELQSAKRNPCIVVIVEPPPTLTSPS